MSESWMDSAVCAGVDPDLWFPEKGSNSTRALRMCSSCPVTMECLEYQMGWEDLYIRYGIFGGLTAEQRRKLADVRRR